MVGVGEFWGSFLQESDDSTSFVESAANGVSAALEVVDNAVAQGVVGWGRILEVVGFKIESVTLIKVCRYTCLVVYMYYNLNLMCLFFDNCKYDVYILYMYIF